MAKRTVRNWEHPRYKLSRWRDSVRSKLRALSNDALRVELQLRKIETGPTRKEMLKALELYQVERFKKAWEEENGWPFDDINDPEKMKQNLRDMAERARGNDPSSFTAEPGTTAATQ